MRSRFFRRRRRTLRRSKSIPAISQPKQLSPPRSPKSPRSKAEKKPKNKKPRRPFSLRRERKKKHQRRSSESYDHANGNFKPNFDMEAKVEPIFGVSLVLSMKRHDGKQVHPILSEICNSLRRRITTIGLFRLSPLNTELDQLRDDIERGLNPNLNQVSGHLLAGLFKDYFNHLPEPLMTFDLYDNFLQYAHNPDDKLDMLHEAVEKMPKVHKDTLEYILDFLSEVVEEEANLMETEAVARILIPNLMRPRVLSPEVLLKDTRVAFYVLRKLLEERIEQRETNQRPVLLPDDSSDEEFLFGRKRYQTVG